MTRHTVVDPGVHVVQSQAVVRPAPAPMVVFDVIVL
jgi:hypothetical protein